MTKSPQKAAVITMAFLFTVILVISGVIVKGVPNAADSLKYMVGWETHVAEKTADSYYDNNTVSYVLEMSHDLENNMLGKVISFRTNDSYLDAYFVNEEGKTRLYHFGEKTLFTESPGTYTHFIPLPDSGEGQILIRIETAYANKFLKSYDVALGSRNELIYGYLREELISFIPNVVLIIFGLLLIIIYLFSVLMHSPIPEALSLGSIAVVFTIYNNCPLFTNQYIFQNPVTQYYLNYFALYLLPLLAIIYFEDIVPELNMKWVFYAFAVLDMILSVMHFTGIASYTRTIKIFVVSLGLFALISVFMIARKFRKMTFLNRTAIVVLLLFILINVFFFVFVSTLGQQSYFTKIGLLMYNAIAIVDGMQKLMNGFFRERENELLHEIAYSDNLTKLGNRYALERDAQKMPLNSISIVSLDLNYLKYTNDTFGHAGGDVLLRCASECISSVFDKVYRVGGDEFIALISKANEADLEAKIAALYKKADEYNRKRTYFEEFAENEDFILSIAAGYASYQQDDSSYEQIMVRADEKMYIAKKKMHAKSSIRKLNVRVQNV